VAAAGAAGIAMPLSACRPGGASERWAWVHGNRDRAPGEWRRKFDRLADAGFRGVLVGGGKTGTLSDAARSAGLEFHRWMWTLNRNGDSFARENHPEWFTVSRNLESSLTSPPYVGYYKWLCPSRAEVRDYIRGKVAEIAADPAVDGVHLDYVRHCDVILPRGLWETYELVQDTELPQFDFCYCDECRRQFATLEGRDPAELTDAPSDAAWRQFRWNSVSRLVNELTEEANGHGKPISAAVFPTPTIARTLVRQDWDKWPLDRFFPMLYQGFYLEDTAWIGRGVAEGLEALAANGSSAPLIAGLYLPQLDEASLANAVASATAAGAHGVSAFESNGLDGSMLQAFGSGADQPRRSTFPASGV